MTQRAAKPATVCEHAVPYVREELDTRSMHFSMAAIQSRMQIRRPEVLELEYTRCMMGFLMFRPQAERLLMIGLGGGSLAKFCHRHLPHAAMVVVEISAQVIALRERFLVPPDGPRFKVIEGDGARFVAETEDRFDVLLVDAFDAHGTPSELGTQRFYDDCCDVLTTAGMVVVNLHASDPNLPVCLARIGRSFGPQRLLRIDDHDASNSVVFACKDDSLRRAGRDGVRRPVALAAEAWDELSAPFARIAAANRHDDAARTRARASPSRP